jgi:hypothetical protein
MESKKVKQLKPKNCKTAIKCIQKGIDFNLQVSPNRFIMFVGGILSKIEDGQQFVYIRERGWVGI